MRLQISYSNDSKSDSTYQKSRPFLVLLRYVYLTIDKHSLAHPLFFCSLRQYGSRKTRRAFSRIYILNIRSGSSYDQPLRSFILPSRMTLLLRATHGDWNKCSVDLKECPPVSVYAGIRLSWPPKLCTFAMLSRRCGRKPDACSWQAASLHRFLRESWHPSLSRTRVGPAYSRSRKSSGTTPSCRPLVVKSPRTC